MILQSRQSIVRGPRSRRPARDAHPAAGSLTRETSREEVVNDRRHLIVCHRAIPRSPDLAVMLRWPRPYDLAIQTIHRARPSKQTAGFLIQNTQTRDTAALQMKLDE